MQDKQLTAVEMEFAALYPATDDPIGLFVSLFDPARILSLDDAACALAGYLARPEVKLEIYVQERIRQSWGDYWQRYGLSRVPPERYDEIDAIWAEAGETPAPGEWMQ